MSVAYQRGLILFRHHRYSLAAEEFRRALQDDPQNGWAHAMLSQCLSWDNQPDAAVAAAEDAVAAAPMLPFAHYVLASAMLRKPWRESLSEFAQMSVGLLRAAHLGHLERAHKPCLEAVRLDPDYADALGLLATIHLDLDEPHSCLEAAERGLKADPNHIFCANMRARALQMMGHRKAARSTLQRALEVDPENELTFTSRGQFLLEVGKAAEACEAFAEALRINPNSSAALRGFKRAQRASQQPDGLIQFVIAFVIGLVLLAMFTSEPGGQDVWAGTALITVALMVWGICRRGQRRRRGR